MMWGAAILIQRDSDESREAWRYLTEIRGISEDTIKNFRVGYVPSFVRNEFGDIHEFAGRIIVPVFDQYGELVALSSRDWRKNAYRKFHHEQYFKSLYLFGLNVAKPSIIKSNVCIIVEGEFDVMALHSDDIDCTVGTVGTSLQLYQISLLKRYCSNIYLVFDGDEAGASATKRALKLSDTHHLHNCDINMIPVYLPGGKDPDNIIQEEGSPGFMKRLQEAKAKFKEIYRD